MAYSSSLHHAAYKEAQQCVSKCRQVIMLYDGAIHALEGVVRAIEARDVEGRYNGLDKAFKISQGLQSALDLERGGDIAQYLADYYHDIDMRLFAIHHSNSVLECRAIIEDLSSMRDAWVEVEEETSGGHEKKEGEGLGASV